MSVIFEFVVLEEVIIVCVVVFGELDVVVFWWLWFEVLEIVK